MLVLPGAGGGTRMIVANLNDRAIEIEAEPGLQVERVVGAAAAPNPA